MNGLWLDDLLRDVQHAIRRLWRDRLFAFTAFLTLGLGMAATVAMLMVVDAVLIRPLPFRAPHRLVGIIERHLQRGIMAVTPANLRDIQRQATVFATLGAFESDQANLHVGNAAQSVEVGRLGRDIFDVLDVTPAMGRAFAPGDLEPGANHVALVSYATWQQAFGGSSSVLGTTIRLGLDSYTVVGVLPKQFSLFSNVAIWTSWLAMTEPSAWDDRQFHHFIGVGRLRDGVSLDEARAELTTLARRLSAEYPATNANWTFDLPTLSSMILGPRVRPMIVTLTAAAGLVLLIGCINLANLLFARAAGRCREIAIRLSLGCSRDRLIRQLLAKSAVLVAGGMMAGLMLIAVALPLVRQIPLSTTFPFAPQFHPDLTLVLTVLGVLIAATVLAGLGPAWQASDVGALRTSLTSRAGSPGRRGVRAHQVLIGGEIAVTLVLLVSAGVLVKSFDRLARVNLGLAPDHVLTAEMTLDEGSYATPSARAQYWHRVLDRVQSLPGITAAAIANYTPITLPGNNLRFAIEGRATDQIGDVTTAPLATVSPGFFATLHIPLIRGRLFDDDDVDRSPPVMLVNASFARQFFGVADPVGYRMRVLVSSASPWRTIVGVVGDVRGARLEEGPVVTMYTPLAQDPRGNTLLVRTTRSPALAAPMLRDALAAVDPNEAVAPMRPLDEVIADAMSPSRFRASVVSLFALCALILAAVGVYGVMSSIMMERTTEWGIRLALGADPRALLLSVVGRALATVMAGIGAGGLGCLVVARLLGSVAFEVSWLDPMSLAVAATVLLMVAAVATYIPAHRATKTDPLAVLRCD